MPGIFTRVATLDADPGAAIQELGRQAGQAVGKGFGDAGRLIVRGVQAVKQTPQVRSITEPVGAAELVTSYRSLVGA